MSNAATGTSSRAGWRRSETRAGIRSTRSILFKYASITYRSRRCSCVALTTGCTRHRKSMAEVTWLQIIVLALGSSVLVKVLDIIYQEVVRWRANQKSAEQVTDQHIFPLLKAADELLGKLHTLADKDFKSIQGITPDEKCLSNADFGSLVYLFGMFWSRVEALRQALSVTMANEKRGKELQDFFDCMEAPKVRLVETIQQRAVGEMLVENKEVRGFTAFVAAVQKEGELGRGIETPG